MDKIIPDWQAPTNVKAFSTTRFSGFSLPPFDEFNLASHVGDKLANVLKNRAKLQQHLPGKAVWLSQTHTTKIVQLPNTDYLKAPPNADASFTETPNTVCVVLTADCLPVFFSTKRGDKVAVAHAGWQGLADGILEETVKVMGGGSELLAHLAPAIGQASFKVGENVKAKFTKHLPETKTAFIKTIGNKYLADIYQIAKLRLSKIGVCQITGGGFDTKTDKRFFSYRAENKTGRMASLVWFE